MVPRVPWNPPFLPVQAAPFITALYIADTYTSVNYSTVTFILRYKAPEERKKLPMYIGYTDIHVY